jgi:hypothetical protein
MSPAQDVDDIVHDRQDRRQRHPIGTSGVRIDGVHDGADAVEAEPRLILDHVQLLDGTGVLPQGPAQQVDVQLDGRQRRLELVCHCAGDAADFREALCFGRAPLFRERVGEVGEEQRGRAAPTEQR